MAESETVFFLSDYGRRDEFVGVVHAVLRRLAPGAVVVDLTHDVPPFDVRAGAWSLARTIAHLGPGVVLAVVDPGVGGTRRSVALEGPADSVPRWFVGPDNGLLLPALDLLGGVTRAVTLTEGPADAASAVTFAGRDLFAPAVAALCGGKQLEDLGSLVDPAELTRLPPPVVEYGRLADGRRCLRAEVTWVDHFGNVQLAVGADWMPGASLLALTKEVVAGHLEPGGAIPGPSEGQETTMLVRRVRTFTDLMGGEVGLLADANGRLALVLREGSAASRLGLEPGYLVNLAW